MLPVVFTLLSLIGASAIAASADAKPLDPTSARTTGLVSRELKINSANYTYQVYVPEVADKSKEKLPVVLFLHGIGQRGEGGFVPAGARTNAIVESYMKGMKTIVVLPQCKSGRYWSDDEMTRMTMSALDAAIEEFGGDRERVYLVGVSMGGYGAWHLAAEHPERFAAVVPICGGSPLRADDRHAAIARKVKNIPVWVFHGAADRIVPVSESRLMVEALRRSGGQVRYSEVENVGHNVWLNALAEPELLPWLLRQRLTRSA